MTKYDIPISSKQLFYLALLILLPLALAVAAVFWAPPKPGHGKSDGVLALAIIGVIAIGISGMLITAAKRHVLELSQNLLVVKHSLYTLTLQRHDVASASIRAVSSLDQLGMSTRKNGIAAFGYFSGWFWNTQGHLTFCAFSTLPVYLITFEGSARCRQLALGASPEMIRSIEAWSQAADCPIAPAAAPAPF